ncbi:MAG TPA: hypothetical protein VIY52_17125 [Streptosporangiaceae bacterium]
MNRSRTATTPSTCRTQIAGVEPGRQVRLHGMVGIGGDGHPAMINPVCEPRR